MPRCFQVESISTFPSPSPGTSVPRNTMRSVAYDRLRSADISLSSVALKTLPTSITWLNLDFTGAHSSSSLDLVQDLPNLRYLRLSHLGLPGSKIGTHFVLPRGLESLEVAHPLKWSHSHSVALKWSLIHLHNLKSLRLIGITNVDDLLGPFTAWTTLEELHIYQVDFGVGMSLYRGLELLTSLKRLSLKDNNSKQFTSFYLCSALRKLSALEEFSFVNNPVNSMFARNLLKALAHSPRLQLLDISGITRAEDGNSAEIFEMISLMSKLRVLDVSSTGLNSRGAQFLSSTIARLPDLVQLRINNNHVAGQLEFIMAALFNWAPRLEHLGLRNVSDSILSPQAFEYLGRLSAMRELDVGDNMLFGTHIAKIVRAIEDFPELRSLRIDGCGLYTSSIDPILVALTKHGSIEDLDLSNNMIDQRGIQSLSLLIPFMPKLRSLRISKNPTFGLATRQLLEALSQSPIQELYFEDVAMDYGCAGQETLLASVVDLMTKAGNLRKLVFGFRKDTLDRLEAFGFDSIQIA